MEQELSLPPALELAYELRDQGQPEAATTELETALDEVRQRAEAGSFQDRVILATTLADFYLEAGALKNARELLAAEISYAEEAYSTAKRTGSPPDKREILNGLAALRDQHTQVTLIGETAPEFDVKTWINCAPLTLAGQRGQVVLLEFWATWCKPCRTTFPKLKALYEKHAARGLNVIALTHHYFADQAAADSLESELELIRNFVREHELSFPVGVAEDARIQMQYGAMGMPTLVLIDRLGVVRGYGRLDNEGHDPQFEATLDRCLDAPA